MKSISYREADNHMLDRLGVPGAEGGLQRTDADNKSPAGAGLGMGLFWSGPLLLFS